MGAHERSRALKNRPLEARDPRIVVPRDGGLVPSYLALSSAPLKSNADLLARRGFPAFSLARLRAATLVLVLEVGKLDVEGHALSRRGPDSQTSAEPLDGAAHDPVAEPMTGAPFAPAPKGGRFFALHRAGETGPGVREYDSEHVAFARQDDVDRRAWRMNGRVPEKIPKHA